MKKLILIVLLALGMQQTQAQVWDITTGVDNMMNLLPLNTPDDNWTMCPPAGNWMNPGSYIPVMCSNGAPVGFSPYAGHWNSVRWLSPNVVPSGKHGSAPGGFYYYRYEFTTGNCEVESAVINLDHIGGDNVIDQFIINGNVYPCNYTFNPFTNGATIPLSNGDILVNQVNTILVRVNNYSDSFTGMEIAGNITVQTINTPDPNFGSSFWNNQLNLGSTVAGSHTWEIYGSVTGNVGTYSYIGTYYSPTLGMSSSAYNCYFVKHTVTNDCGSACKAISICNLNCSWQPCGIAEPTNLHYDPATKQLSWDAVPGVDHYVVEIVLNDPACCGDGTVGGPILASNYRTITTYTNSYTLGLADLGDVFFQCFSWRVLAVCANGYSTASAFKCEGSWQNDGARSYIDNGVHNEVEEREVLKAKVYPNPSEGVVNIAVESLEPVDYDVKIYDINGKLVKTFVNMQGEESNTTVQWNAEDVGKGTYLVVITTSDNKVLQRKVVIE